MIGRFSYLLFSLVAACNVASFLPGSPSTGSGQSEWKSLPPLPDAVGFAGMFGGVLNRQLIAGGGSQWDKPLWLKGAKTFSDRIFSLDSISGQWKQQVVKLPQASGNFAAATTPNAIYLAGGIAESGCLRSVYELGVRGDVLVFTQLADLPVPLGYAAAAIAGGRLYVVGGLDEPSAKIAKKEVWSLGIDELAPAKMWRQEAELPGSGVFVAAAAGEGDNLYVFGGMEYDPSGKPLPSRHAYRRDPKDGKWVALADLPEARVGPASPCPVLSNHRIFLAGGYAEVFPGAPREHPGFSAQTFFYEIGNGRWENGPLLPHAAVADRDAAGDPGPAPMLASPIVVWQNHAVAISGEVRASVRSPQVLAWPIPH